MGWEGQREDHEWPKAKTPKEHLGQPQSLAESALTPPGHTQETLYPHQQMGFVVDDLSWNKNTSPTSYSIFTESHETEAKSVSQQHLEFIPSPFCKKNLKKKSRSILLEKEK